MAPCVKAACRENATGCPGGEFLPLRQALDRPRRQPVRRGSGRPRTGPAGRRRRAGLERRRRHARLRREEGLGWKSVLVIWIHGTLEISAIVIAGTAGMILGHALLFPGTFKRIDSLKRGAKDAAKIVIGLIPIFLVAAFFEGFITRHTGMPIVFSLSILLASAAFIIWYFIVYPILLKRSGVTVINGKVEFPAA